MSRSSSTTCEAIRARGWFESHSMRFGRLGPSGSGRTARTRRATAGGHARRSARPTTTPEIDSSLAGEVRAPRGESRYGPSMSGHSRLRVHSFL